MSAVERLKTTAPEIQNQRTHGNKDWFERKANENNQDNIHQRVRTFDAKEQYTKMNLTTIDDFQEENANHPEHNITIRGRGDNLEINLNYCQNTFEEFAGTVTDLKDTYNRLRKDLEHSHHPRGKLFTKIEK